MFGLQFQLDILVSRDRDAEFPRLQYLNPRKDQFQKSWTPGKQVKLGHFQVILELYRRKRGELRQALPPRLQLDIMQSQIRLALHVPTPNEAALAYNMYPFKLRNNFESVK